MKLSPSPRRLATCTAILTVVTGCLGDAEHSNPLDPLAPEFVDEGFISGRIQNRSLSGIAGVTVTTMPGAATTVTSSDGEFRIEELPAGTYVVTASGLNYEIGIDTVDVSLIQPGRADFELNGMPRLESITVNTAHVSRWWPLEDLYRMEVSVVADDADGVFDLDKLWIDIPSLQFSDTMQVTQTPGLFVRTVEETDLPSGTIHALLGTPVELHARDQQGAVVVSPSVQLVRVIDETPEATDEAFQFGAPNCLQIESGNTAIPVVEWKEVFLPFPFQHEVEVIRVDPGVESLVERLTNIPADSTSVDASGVPPGDYYWTVSVIDDFSNSSRSKQVGFCVTL
ncbi:MAG: carboxypeptidase-like regulatory domain-containing protein [Rhodothermia bacterium]|nr:carboxypeptidase-like regulatory domain-containing protein [Rhodothermia bacterium]